MPVIIGSARIDERGKLNNGAAGDQKQTTTPDTKGEVSMQNFYVHKKGWVVLRAKDRQYGKKIANAMERACNNANIGYDQNQRLGIISKGTKTTTKTECDCSSLVRQCVREATGIDPGNFTTADEVSKLLYTKMFDRISYTNGMELMEGDILVTKTKGHTAVVVSIGKDYPTLRRGSRGGYVKELQTLLNYSGCGARLEVDGEFGVLSEMAVIQFQALHGLKRDGVVGPATWAELLR